MQRVERQHALQPEHGVEQHEARGVEADERARVADPPLPLVRIDARGAVDATLHRLEHRVQPGGAALEHARQIQPQRPGEADRQRDGEGDLRPTLPGHGIRSERLGAQQGCDHVDGDADRRRSVDQPQHHAQSLRRASM